jgi:hypothetical protein
VPSSAFLVSTVGVALFDDRPFGVLLYGITLLSALLLGVVWARLPMRKKRTSDLSASFSSSDAAKDSLGSLRITTLTDAIGSSALAMLRICAFVVFFSTLVGILSAMLSSFHIPSALTPLWFGFFEMTQGVTEASFCLSRHLGVLSAAAVSGWSGLSVHFQLMSLCQNHALSFRPYFLAKVLAALLNFTIVTFALLFFPSLLLT